MTSPLLFPVKLKDKKILVLDETKLPFKEFYIAVSSLDEALHVLRSMKTRSLGQVFLFRFRTRNQRRIEKKILEIPGLPSVGRLQYE